MDRRAVRQAQRHKRPSSPRFCRIACPACPGAVSPSPPSVEVDGEGGQKAFLSAKNGCQSRPSEWQSAGRYIKIIDLAQLIAVARHSRTRITGLSLKRTAQSRSRGRSPNTLSHSLKARLVDTTIEVLSTTRTSLVTFQGDDKSGNAVERAPDRDYRSVGGRPSRPSLVCFDNHASQRGANFFLGREHMVYQDD